MSGAAEPRVPAGQMVIYVSSDGPGCTCGITTEHLLAAHDGNITARAEEALGAFAPGGVFETREVPQTGADALAAAVEMVRFLRAPNIGEIERVLAAVLPFTVSADEPVGG